MTVLECVKSGLIYRNPLPHVKSVHAYFPSVVKLPGGEMLASFNLGQAFEAADLHVHLARSRDEGESWTFEGPIYPVANERMFSTMARLTAAPDGQVVAYLHRHNRSRPNTGLGNPQTLGFVETEPMLMRSADGGRSWDGPTLFASPIVGSPLEMCSPITVLRDGRWLISTSTWRAWNGECPDGLRMVALVSHDCGETWPEYWDVMCDPNQEIIYWESKVIELQDGRLLGVAWGYNEKKQRDLPNPYAVSCDKGKTFTAPRSTGLLGQTMTPLLLEDGKILVVYRRIDRPGLWANISRLEGDEWINEAELPLWGNDGSGLTATGGNMVENFNVLRFGAPTLLPLDNGIIFVAFWAVEDGVSVIRWFKLQVS